MEFASKTRQKSVQQAKPSRIAPSRPVNRDHQSDIRRVLHATGAQAKLTIGQPNDKYEQEADRIADQVMRMSDADVAQQVETGTVQPMQIQRMCTGCEEEMAQRQPMEEEELQAKEMPGQTLNVTPNLESRINSLKGGGQPLDTATRNFFEPRFGHDFSSVRVHQSGQAADVSRSINARAFALGNNVVFGSGQYQSQSSEGKRLLGHELTHVVQQRDGAIGEVSVKQIQRTEAETLQHCPPYWRWETPRNIETYNCGGLAHRTYDYKSLLDVSTLLVAGNTACGANKIKHWFWRYNLHFEDYQGTKTGGEDRDFHTVAGMIDPHGNDPADVYSKNGKRSVHGPSTGPSFRPPAKAQARANNANARLLTDRNGRPVYKVRTNFQTSVVCLNCPSPRT